MSAGHIVYTANSSSPQKQKGRSVDHSTSSSLRHLKSSNMVLSLLLWSSSGSCSTGIHAATANGRNHAFYPIIRASTAFVVPTTPFKYKSAAFLLQKSKHDITNALQASQFQSSVSTCYSHRGWGTMISFSEKMDALTRSMSTTNEEMTEGDVLTKNDVKSYDLLNRERGNN